MRKIMSEVTESKQHQTQDTSSVFGKIGRLIRRYPARVAYCEPYWNVNTYQVLFRDLMTFNIVEGRNVKKLESALQSIFGVSELVTCSSGRLALEFALKSMGIKPGSEVVIPSFACDGVIQPILRCDAIPVFAEIGEDLNVLPKAVEKALNDRTHSVIVPHLFGNPADIGEIVEICEPRGIKIIDDAAQAFGATIDNKWLGTFGDIGVHSFGNGKVCFGTGGGILVTQNLEYIARVKEFAWGQCNAKEIIGNALHTLTMRKWRRWSFPLERLTLGRRKQQKEAYPVAPMANLNAGVALSLLKTIDKNIDARRQRAKAYRGYLDKVDQLRLVEHKKGSVCLTQPIIVGGHDARQTAELIRDALNDNGYEINMSYKPLHLKPSFRPYLKEPLDYTDQVWDKIIELPCEPSVSFNEVKRISEIILSFVRG